MKLCDCMQVSDIDRERALELAVPVLAFGGTFIGILLWGAGLKIEFQYFAAGCVISSFLLAYLAWIRPRKDIVAISTPVYAIVFFVAPVDSAAGAVLQLLYAASLTILLFRLKYRFGGALPLSTGLSPNEPLGKYVRRLARELSPFPAPASRRAGLVFIRFAQGEYDQARELSQFPHETATAKSSVLSRAFTIVAEQAGQITIGESAPPGDFIRFLPEDLPVLFHPMDLGVEREFSLALDNALILLYSVALQEMEAELTPYLPFARKLCGD